MKAQMLKIAGVKSEKEFYKKFPDEASFMKAHGKEFKKAMRASKVDKAQLGINQYQMQGGGPTYQISLGGPTLNPDAVNVTWNNSTLPNNFQNLAYSSFSGGTTRTTTTKLPTTGTTTTKNPTTQQYVQGATDLIGGAMSLKQQKQDVRGAKQQMMLSGVQTKAAGLRPVEPIKRQYIRPEDVVYQPEQMFPSYGVGTNVLAEDGAVINEIGGNPTEIMNTFAPNVLYTNLGYEPLSDSDQVKQYYHGGVHKAQYGTQFMDFMTDGGGDAIGMGIDALTSKGGYQEAGSRIGGGAGRIIGTAIGGQFGGMVGNLAGKFIGGAIDQSSEKIARYNQQSQQNIGQLMGSQAGMQFQNQFRANVRYGGTIKAQDGDLTKKDGKCRAEEARNKEYAAIDKASAAADRAGEIAARKEAKEIAAQRRADYNDYINERLNQYGEKVKQKDFDAGYQAFVAQNPELAKDRLLYTIANKELKALRSNKDYYLRNAFRKVDPQINFETLTLPTLMQSIQKGFGGTEGYLNLWNQGFPERLLSIPQPVPVQQEDGGTTSPYAWVSHTWQPQVITHFGEHRVSDLLRPPSDADMLRAGGEVRNIRKNYMSPEEEMMTNMAFGGQLKTTWGGHAEPISQNPYMPATGQTIMFRGQSHDESDGKGRTGIGVKYGKPDSYTEYAEYGAQADADVEVERNEPAVELPNKDGDNSMVVFGNLKVPNQFLDQIGDPKAKGKKFKTYIKDLAKKENRQNKIIEKSSKKLDDLDSSTPFDRLKFNSLAASIEGANMKLKEFAEFKQNAAAVQNAINDTAEEMGLVADDLAKGRVKLDRKALQEEARYGKNVRKAQDGTTVDNDVLTTDLGETITQADLDRLKVLYAEAAKQKQGSAVLAFQKEFHRLFPKSALKYNKDTKFLTAKASRLRIKKEDLDKIDINNPSGDLERRVLEGNEDEYFGPITTKYMAIAEGAKKKTKTFEKVTPQTGPAPTPPPPTTNYPITPYAQNPYAAALSQVMDELRPTDIEPLDPLQLSGEQYALSQNQVEPVWAQKLQPRLNVVPDISLQDILNENEATFRAQQRLFGYSPTAQSELAANKYLANSRVLGEQARMNIGEKKELYADNRKTLDQFDLANMGILDQQYVRQNEALSRTKATTQAALNSIASKIAQNRLENRTLAVLQNRYRFRYDPNFRLRNFQTAGFNIPTIVMDPVTGLPVQVPAPAQTTPTQQASPVLGTPTLIPALGVIDPSLGVDANFVQYPEPDPNVVMDELMQEYYQRSRKGSKVPKNKSSKEARNSSIVKALKNL